jgi:sec-independent protein translocase protein TatA
MGNLFDSPWKVLVVAIVLIVLFGSKKLPDAARSLGKSMRILKAEVSDLHHDEAEAPAQNTPVPNTPNQFPQAQLTSAPAQNAPAPADQQSEIDALKQQVRDLQRSAAMDTPPSTAPAPGVAEPQRTQQPS